MELRGLISNSSKVKQNSNFLIEKSNLSSKNVTDMKKTMKQEFQNSDLQIKIQLGSPAYYELEEVQNDLKTLV
jgi:hypothetical protein